MSHTAKKIIRAAGVVVGLGAAIWALRDHLLPAPEVHTDPPPRFRTGPSDSDKEAGGDDLTTIKGIGPVTAAKLTKNDVTTFAAISEMTPEGLADVAGTSATAAAAWIESAAALV